MSRTPGKTSSRDRVHPRSSLALALIGGLTVLAGVYYGTSSRPGFRLAETLPGIQTPAVCPWRCVGGCGAGGSGGGGGNIKWIGKGVTGGLVTTEIMYSKTWGQNFYEYTLRPRLSVKPTLGTSEIGPILPLQSKVGEAQPTTLFEPKNFITGGTGDLVLDGNMSMGMHGQFNLSGSLTFPTGQYDIKRGSDAKQEFLPVSLQKGGGVYNASVTLGYTKDLEDGMMLYDVTYSHPFNMKPFSGENRFLDEYFDAYKDSTDSKRFFYRFKPYGENDLGGFSPRSLALSAYYAYRGMEGFVHSWGVTFSAPFGVAWVHQEQFAGRTAQYNPRPDPDHQAWTSSLNYGLEASRDKFPLFFAVSLPLHDKADTSGTWNGPDWNDFMQQWTIGAGFKAALVY